MFTPNTSNLKVRTASMLALLLTVVLFAEPVLGQKTPSTPREQKIAALLSQLEEVHAHQQAACDGTCLSLPQYSVMFAGPIEEAGLVAALENITDEELSDPPAPRYQLQGSSWTSTRTHPTIAQGEPFFLTYSFVLDGTSIPASVWDVNQSAQGSNLFATMNAQFPGGMDAFRAEVREAFDQWQAVTNIRYVEVPDDGAAFTFANGGAVPTPTAIGRGDIRIAMRLVDGTGVDLNGDGVVDRDVAAYNRYPVNGGDMVLDSGNIALFTDSTDDYRRLKNVLAHEHGHGLGINHVMPQNATKLMEPALNTNFDGPQEDDIRAAVSLYGDPAETNESLSEAMPIGSVAEGQPALLAPNYEMALERNASDDWYKFNATGGTELTITLEPVGTTYQQGAQPLNAATPVVLNTVNALAARNLQLIIYNAGGILIELADDNPAGQAESLTMTVPGSGIYYTRVNSMDGGNDPQRYRIRVERDGGPEIDVVAQTASPVSVPVGGQYNFGQTTVNTDRHTFFTIENDGTADLSLTNNPFVTIFGTNAADFTVNLQPTSPTVAPGASVAFNIGFRPSAAGTRSATVLISNDDEDESAYSFTVTGTGTQSSSGSSSSGSAQIRVFQITPAFVFGKVQVTEGGYSDFPSVNVGESLPVYYSIENHGTADLQLTDNPPVFFGSGASDFSIIAQPFAGAPIPAGNPEGFAQVFRISFAPQDGSTQTERVFINSNASNTVGPFDFTLRATGVEPAVEIEDCNGNGQPDAEDLGSGASADCNGNGVPDECDPDTDGDGVTDLCDECPGEDDLRDSDDDLVPDCLDECPNDPNKVEPGACGCNVEDTGDCGNPGDVGGDDDDGDDFADNDDGGDFGADDNDGGGDDDDRETDCGGGSAMPLLTATLFLCGTGLGRRQRRGGAAAR